MAAVRLLPFVVVAVVVNLVSGTFLHYFKMYMALYLVAGAFIVAGASPLIVFLSPETPTGVIYGLSVVVAVGAGLSMTLAYTIATLTLEPRDVAGGINMQNVAQIGGQVIALAVASQIYQSTGIRNLKVALEGHGFSEKEIAGAMAGTQSALFQTLEGDLRQDAIRAIAAAMQNTMVVASTGTVFYPF